MPGVFFWFILLFFRHRIYVTGFIKAAAGGTLKWSGKEEKIAVDGRFVLEKVPFWKTEVGSSYAGWYRLSAGLETGTKEKRPVSLFSGKTVRLRSGWKTDPGNRTGADFKRKYIPSGHFIPGGY